MALNRPRFRERRLGGSLNTTLNDRRWPGDSLIQRKPLRAPARHKGDDQCGPLISELVLSTRC
jgi:hypothetical protein